MLKVINEVLRLLGILLVRAIDDTGGHTVRWFLRDVAQWPYAPKWAITLWTLRGD